MSVFAPGHMVAVQVTKPSYDLVKGDSGVVISVANKDVEVEFMAEGKPNRRVFVPADDLAPVARARDVVGEGKEALGLRSLVISLVGTYDTLEEVRERFGHISAAAEISARLAHSLKCEPKEVEHEVMALSDRAHSLANEINTVREAAQKHSLVIVGPSNLKRVYIDISREEAVKRYLVEHERAEIGDIPVSELACGDTFSATTVGPA